MKEKLRKILNVISVILFILSLFIYFLSKFINERFDDISFEQLIYATTNTKGANYEIVLIGAASIIFNIIVILAIILSIKYVWKFLKIKICFKIGFEDKIFRIYPFKKTILNMIIILTITMYFLLSNSFDLLNLDDFIKSQRESSNIFEDYYVDGREIELKFPDKKRNLIYIYAESMEMTNASIENGGFVEKSYIPKLEKLALENINFSNTGKLGGAYQVSNTSWTIAALIAQTAGVPLKTSIDENSYKNYSDSLPGVYNLGDILSDNDYNNYFLIGSDADFGGRDDYFKNHGNYTIYDYIWAKDEGLIDPDYYIWWGYEDKKLFSYAKDQILEAAKLDEPFNFTILTVDTHFTDGYMDDSCKDVFDTAYANAIYCSDSKIYSFIKWIKKQDFYENTTVIISGDHLTMQNGFYEENDNLVRTTYNAFINSPIKPINEKNREFSTFDLFPTTLAALGVEIEGNRLGLGVNLFSEEKTLVEELGYGYLNTEIPKKSFYYDNKILGDTYYEIQEQLKEEN